MKTTRITASLGFASVLLGGCSFTGVNSLPLPFTKGAAPEDIQATVILENATNLVPNSEVKLDNLTIGAVRKIEFSNWRAKLSISVDKDARVPAAVTAKVAQKSLLGAEYLELSPAGDEPQGMLSDGDVIGLDRTGRYPETEEVLAAASLLLNGGGLGQMQTINHELNAALGGRGADVRSFVDELGKFIESLDKQRWNIITTLDQVDRFSREINSETEVVNRALTELPRGFDALADDRKALAEALESVSDLSEVAHRIVQNSGDDLRVDLKDLAKVTGGLAKAGDSLGRAFGAASFPFPISAADPILRGDYMNFYAVLDVSLEQIQRFYLGGTALDPLLAGLTGSLPSGTAADITDPRVPLESDNDTEVPSDPVGDVADKVGGVVRDLTGVVPSRPKPEQTAQPSLLDRLLGGL